MMNLLDSTEFKIDPPISQPAYTSIRLQRETNQLTINIPPVGVWKRTKGIIIIGLMMIVYAAITLLFLDKTARFEQAIFGVIFVFGTFLLFVGFDLGKRSNTLIVRGKKLGAVVHGLFGTKYWLWQEGEVSQIKISDGDTLADGVVIRRLQILPSKDDTVDLIFACSNEELLWIIYELRRAWFTFEEVDGVGALPQTISSKIKVERDPQRLVIQLPARINRGTLIFGALWCLAMLIVTSQFLMRPDSYGDVSQNKMLGIMGVMVFLWGIGLVMIGMAIDSMKRRSTLLIQGGRLIIVSTGLFGTKHWQWSQGDIMAIGVSPNEDTEVTELKIISLDGKITGFFSGREAAELTWLAQELSQYLRLNHSSLC